MPFEAIPGQFYRIIAKHSGKAIGSNGTVRSRGAILAQVESAQDDFGQQFTFERDGEHFYNIRYRHNSQNIDVFSEKTDDNAAVGQWDQSPGHWNQQFSILPAGDGTHFISARHSAKFLCVQGRGMPAGIPVVQHRWTGGDHFLFTIEAVPPYQRRALREPVLRQAEPTREAVLGLVGLIPDVGGGVKAVAGVLWKATPSLIEQMRDYVTSIAQSLIDEEYIRQLGKQLQGIRNNLKQFAQATVGADKGTWMTQVIGSLEIAQPYFFDDRAPERTLPHLITLGTLHLTALRERYDKYIEYYGKKPDNPEELLQDLKNRVKLYTDGVATARRKTLEWRLSHIHEWSDDPPAGIQYMSYFARDDYDGWQFSSVRRDRTAEQRQIARDAALIDRTRQVSEQFNAELDGLFAAATAWRYLDPDVTEKPKITPVVVSTGTFGRESGAPFDTGQVSTLDSPIAGVTMWFDRAGNQLHGIQIRKRDGSRLMAGIEHQNSISHDWADREQVVAAFGNTRESVAALNLVSNRHALVGHGQRALGIPFRSESPLPGGTLNSIFGWASRDRIEGIGFRWTYPKNE
jgi:hypothetical protein